MRGRRGIPSKSVLQSPHAEERGHGDTCVGPDDGDPKAEVNQEFWQQCFQGNTYMSQ